MKRKFWNLLICMIVLFSFGAIVAFADSPYNKYVVYSFQMDGDWEYSPAAEKPADDGDERYYVTTLPSYGNSNSDVFSHGGTFYCRSRPYADRAGKTQYAYGLSFTSMTSKKAYYYNDASNKTGIIWGGDYCLRAEIENGNYGWDERIQVVRWCP